MYEITNVVMIGKHKYVVLATFQIVLSCFEILNNG